MSEQQPHLEILSRNRVNRSRITVFVIAIPVTVFTGLMAYALLPFLWLIGYGMMALATVSFLYLVAVLVIDVRRRWFQSQIVYIGEHGVVDAASGQVYPLALPAPIITEEKSAPAVDRSQEEADILDLHAHGSGFKAIAQAYKDAGNTYWTEYRVRQVCNRERFSA